MANKKYVYFLLEYENEDSVQMNSYKNAFSAFQRCNDSVTLYGVDEWAEVTTIMSK